MFNSLVYNRLIVFFVLVIIIIYIDVSIVGIATQYNLFNISYSLELIFLIIMLITIVSIVLILIHVNRLIKENKNIIGKDLIISSKLVIIAQSIILILLTTILLQTLSQDNYHFILSMLIVLISYSIGLLFTILLAIKFLKWYKIDKEKMIFVNFLSIVFISLIIIFSLLYYLYENIENFNTTIGSENIYRYIHTTSPIPNIFLNYYNITFLVTFMSIWIISMSLLRFHLKSINIYIYLILYSIPLIYFLFNSLPFANDIHTSILIRIPPYYDVIYTTLFSGSGVLTGFLFFLPMWFFAKKMGNNEIKKFLTLTSFGMLIFFTINTLPPLSEKWFPPFGIISYSLTGFSIFLIFNGFYSTAVYLSKIKYFTHISLNELENEKYFKSIARSQLEEELQGIISNAIQKDIIHIKQEQLSSDEIVNLITIVKEEVKNMENRNRIESKDDTNNKKSQ